MLQKDNENNNTEVLAYVRFNNFFQPSIEE